MDLHLRCESITVCSRGSKDEPGKVVMAKKNPFKCMVHEFISLVDPEIMEPVEVISGCVYCGHSERVTVVAGKVTAFLGLTA
jgi:hypothetical protein